MVATHVVLVLPASQALTIDTPSPPIGGFVFLCLYSIHMKTLASLFKRTKSGISAWNFVVVEETNQHFAIGGDDLKVIAAIDRKHLKQIFDSFKRYGYKAELPRTKQVINDPWESNLPPAIQMELEALAVA